MPAEERFLDRGEPEPSLRTVLTHIAAGQARRTQSCSSESNVSSEDRRETLDRRQA